MQRNDWFFFAGAVTALAVALIVAMSALGLQGGDPAWVQAIGSLVGIGVAIWVPTQIALSERAERRDARINRTGALASNLVGAIFLLDADLIRTDRLLTKVATAHPSELDWQDWFQEAKIKIPDSLVSTLSLMVDVEESMVVAIRMSAVLAMTYNGYVEKFGAMEMAKVVPQWSAAYRQMRDQLDFTRKIVDQAKKAYGG